MMATNENLKFEFESLFGLDKLNDFWSSQDLSHPKFAAVKKKSNFKHKAIPLCIHGDGVEFQDRDTLMTISFSGLLKEVQTLDANLLLALQ